MSFCSVLDKSRGSVHGACYFTIGFYYRPGWSAGGHRGNIYSGNRLRSTPRDREKVLPLNEVGLIHITEK